MWDIAAPPAPSLGAGLDLACAAAGLALGAGLILWGRKLHRLVMLLAMAGLGALVAGTVGAWLKGADATAVLVCTAVLFAVAGLIIAKAAWALALSALISGSLLLALACRFQPPDPPAGYRPTEASLPAWARAAGNTLADYTARALWVHKDAYWTFHPADQVQWTPAAWKIQLAVAVTGMSVFLLALFAGRLPPLLLCSMLGAGCFLGGLALLFNRLWPAFWAGAWERPAAPAVAVGALTFLGLGLQYRALARQRQQEQARRAGTGKGEKPDAKGA